MFTYSSDDGLTLFYPWCDIFPTALDRFEPVVGAIGLTIEGIPLNEWLGELNLDADVHGVVITFSLSILWIVSWLLKPILNPVGWLIDRANSWYENNTTSVVAFPPANAEPHVGGLMISPQCESDRCTTENQCVTCRESMQQQFPQFPKTEPPETGFTSGWHGRRHRLAQLVQRWVSPDP